MPKLSSNCARPMSRHWRLPVGAMRMTTPRHHGTSSSLHRPNGTGPRPPACSTPNPQPSLPWEALVAGLTEQNLPQRWEQARQQDCAEAFQQTLLRLCFEQPGLRNTITAWAVQQLEWLTPWQAVVMTPSQEEALSNGLLQEYRQGLQDLLEAGQEREFVNRLKDYGEQPWLKVFDRRREWQPIILQLLHETRWSLPLFDRVCQLFDWDERKGNTPEPEWTWRAFGQGTDPAPLERRPTGRATAADATDQQAANGSLPAFRSRRMASLPATGRDPRLPVSGPARAPARAGRVLLVEIHSTPGSEQ